MLFVLAILRDGTARCDDGFSYPRWALCASPDVAERDPKRRRPFRRYRNGGPAHLVRTSAMKSPPDWQFRAAAYVDAVGGLPLSELEAVAAFYRRHRVGAPVLSPSEAK